MLGDDRLRKTGTTTGVEDKERIPLCLCGSFCVWYIGYLRLGENVVQGLDLYLLHVPVFYPEVDNRLV